MASQSFDHTQTALDIMAQLQDPQWALEAARLEEEANCDIGAGHDWGPLLGQFMANPQGFHQYQQLRSLVLKTLQQLLAEGNLGVGLDNALAIGKERLLRRLQQPTPEIQAQLKTVLAEALSHPSSSISDSAQALLKKTIYAALTDEDWQAIANAAASAIQLHILTLPRSA